MTEDATDHTLSDGTTTPLIGFGTYPLRGEEGIDALVSALENGYRYLDSAVNYENEPEVGEALRRSGIPREEVRVATKIPGRFHAHDLALQSLRDSAARLGLEQIDVGLIHWPNPSQGLYPQAWAALVEAQREGLVRTIGVSNFTEAHLTRIIEETGVTPALNQVELHPRFPQEEMRAVHARLGILTQAWSPLGKREAPFDEPPVAAAAAAHGVTPGPGHPALARAARDDAAAEVGHAAAAAAEPRRLPASRSPTPRWPRSPRSAAPTAGSSGATRRPTRRCSPAPGATAGSEVRRGHARTCHDRGVTNFLIRVGINAVALWVAALVVPGVDLAENQTSWTTKVVTIVLVALLFGLVNAVIKPIVKFFSFPFVILTLGLFTFVVNAFMLQITEWISDGVGLSFRIDSFFWDAVLAAIVITLVSWVLSVILPDDD